MVTMVAKALVQKVRRARSAKAKAEVPKADPEKGQIQRLVLQWVQQEARHVCAVEVKDIWLEIVLRLAQTRSERRKMTTSTWLKPI